jgi:hypothetical protein
MLLWQFRNYIVAPFGETVEQVFARISALRDSLDGPQVRSGVQHCRGPLSFWRKWMLGRGCMTQGDGAVVPDICAASAQAVDLPSCIVLYAVLGGLQQ